MAFTLIASTKAQISAGTSLTTSAIDTSGADLLVAVSVSHPNSTTVTDNKGNSWTKRTVYGNPNGPRYFITPFDSKPVAIGAGHTFTVTSNQLFATLFVAAFSGSGGSPFEQQNGNIVASGDLVIPSGVLVPAANDDLLVSIFGIDDPVNTGSPAFSVDSGFTILQSADVVPGSTYGGVLAYQIQTTPTTRNPQLARSNANTQNGDAATIFSYNAASSNVHIVTGRGSFPIQSPLWLSTSLSGIPSRLTTGNAEPPNYYHAGMLSWGTTTRGAVVAYPVTRLLDLVQLPSGMDTLWYQFAPGIQATITELPTL